MSSETPYPAFLSARPVWLAGREREMNRLAGFRAIFDRPAAGPVVLRLTAATVYRAFLNGVFLGYGPARAPAGYARVDEIPLDALLVPGRNLLAIEVSAYNINTYYYQDQPGFLQAEIVAGAAVVASTGTSHLQGRMLTERVQRVERYSAARGFSEIYRLAPGYAAWRSDPLAPFAAEPLAGGAERLLLPRRVAYPAFPSLLPSRIVARGRVRARPVAALKRDWTLTMIGPDLRGYREEEIPFLPSRELQGTASADLVRSDDAFVPGAALAPGRNGFHILDFGGNRAGFIGWTVRAPAPLRLYCTFDEILVDGDIDMARLRCVNCIVLDLEPGETAFESIEPYALRYVKFFSLDGGAEVTRVFLREYAGERGEATKFRCSDSALEAIFEAGRETFAQNSVDLLTDCPSRERAGWLCDSFFLARTAHQLLGDTALEEAFLENYLLPREFPFLPEGMVPMCFPADHDNGNFIPNWALWLILQLEEYEARSRNHPMIEKFGPRVQGILDYFARFRNAEGMLEKLEGWIFVEWSKANEFAQDVNFPTNMLYAAALRSAGRLYRNDSWSREGERVAETVRRLAFDGEYFVDNAVRAGGLLAPTANRTEACQYYAYYFDIATPESHPDTWKRIVEGSGPLGAGGSAGSPLHPANALLGYPLRFELLSRYGQQRRLLDEIRALYSPMVGLTGTLWEHVDASASCSHGFASHVVCVLIRDLLGVASVDPVAREVGIRFSGTGIGSCSGEFPCGDGHARLAWEDDPQTRRWILSGAGGFRSAVENRTGKRLEAAGNVLPP
jgi:alpha-L-rhamnosidase